MHFIQKQFDKYRKHFESGGRLSFLYPFFDATETFFFIPGHSTQRDAHVRDSLDLKRYMSFVLVALAAPLLFGIYNAGYQSNFYSGQSTAFIPVMLRGLRLVVPIILVTYAVGFFGKLLLRPYASIPSARAYWLPACCFPLPCRQPYHSGR
jgi:Na+-transporting NADH:ubiquinone oxidoreductase subunit B